MKPIVIHRPLIKRLPPFGEQIHHFYDQICDVLRDHNAPFKEIFEKDRELRKDTEFNHITYHTRNKADNFLNVKMNYLNTYFYLDNLGFSGWSEITRAHFDPSQIDNNAANAYFAELQDRFVIPKNSKYAIPQSSDNSAIPKGAIVIFLQVFSDIVMRQARVSSEEMVRLTIEAANGRPVVIKRHPMCADPASAALIKNAPSMGPFVSITNCGVHDILHKADTVVCMNSGTGFEALLHEKHVITMARTDYHAGTVAIQTDNPLEAFSQPRHDPQYIRNFVYWYLHSQVIDSEAARAREQIEAKLKAKGWI